MTSDNAWPLQRSELVDNSLQMPSGTSVSRCEPGPPCPAGSPEARPTQCSQWMLCELPEEQLGLRGSSLPGCNTLVGNQNRSGKEAVSHYNRARNYTPASNNQKIPIHRLVPRRHRQCAPSVKKMSPNFQLYETHYNNTIVRRLALLPNNVSQIRSSTQPAIQQLCAPSSKVISTLRNVG